MAAIMFPNLISVFSINLKIFAWEGFMARISHFDISALDTARAIDFYEKIFKWKFKKWEGDDMEYWMITTGPKKEIGINGGMSKRMKDNYVVNTINVKSIDKTIKEIEETGGKIITGKSPIPGVGYYAQFEDPEGNLLGLMEPSKKAR
jgi:uncharacterized protein